MVFGEEKLQLRPLEKRLGKFGILISVPYLIGSKTRPRERPVIGRLSPVEYHVYRTISVWGLPR